MAYNSVILSPTNRTKVILDLICEVRKEKFALDQKIRTILREEKVRRSTVTEAYIWDLNDVLDVLVRSAASGRKHISRIMKWKAQLDIIINALVNELEHSQKIETPRRLSSVKDALEVLIKEPELIPNVLKLSKDFFEAEIIKKMIKIAPFKEMKKKILKTRRDEYVTEDEFDWALWEMTHGEMGRRPPIYDDKNVEANNTYSMATLKNYDRALKYYNITTPFYLWERTSKNWYSDDRK